jgi:hypothetical protein
MEILLNPITWLLVVVVIAFIVNIISNRHGSYKGKWVTVRHDALPAVLQKIHKARGFMDSDGIPTSLELSISVVREDTDPVKFQYEIKVPSHVFHNVENDVILKELGLK